MSVCLGFQTLSLFDYYTKFNVIPGDVNDLYGGVNIRASGKYFMLENIARLTVSFR